MIRRILFAFLLALALPCVGRAQLSGNPQPLATPVAISGGGVGLAQVASQQVTTAGTAIAAGVTQAQTGVTITGLTTTSSCTPSIPTALPASWQTGIRMSIVVTANTATLQLTNPTAASITPVAQAVNIKCIL